MKDIIIKRINSKEARLVIGGSNNICVIYNIQIDNNLECRVSDVLNEEWIGETLINFAVHNYVYEGEHKSEFDALEGIRWQVSTF